MRIDVALEHRNLEAELAALHARMRDPSDVLHDLPAVAGPLGDLVFRYRETDGEFYLYVQDPARRVLAGCTVFNRVPELARDVARCVRSPHSRYAQSYRGRGVATAVYRWALVAGMCLVSGPRQSPGAFALWLSLARSYELAFVRAHDRRLRLMASCEQQAAFAELDTRMLLLGAGWTLERFASLARTELPAQAHRVRP